MGVVPLKTKSQRACPFHHVRTQRKKELFIAKKQALIRHWSCQCLDLEFPASITVRNTSLVLISHPVYGIPSQQPEQAKTVVFTTSLFHTWCPALFAITCLRSLFRGLICQFFHSTIGKESLQFHDYGIQLFCESECVLRMRFIHMRVISLHSKESCLPTRIWIFVLTQSENGKREGMEQLSWSLQ